MAPKREHSAEPIPHKMAKKTKNEEQVDDKQKPQRKNDNSIYETPGIVATAHAAAAVDANPPLQQLLKAMEDVKREQEVGDAVVYWMRMQDLRVVDNRALSAASKRAQEAGRALIVLFVFSPGDYKAHDRSPRRIDFVLRNLSIIKDALAEQHIPLHTFSHPNRKEISDKVVELLQEWNVKDIFANIEYEVDELRRDLKLLELAKSNNIHVELFHDRCLVEPGVITTKAGKVPMVFTPWCKNWEAHLRSHPECLEEAPAAEPNDPQFRDHKVFGQLFQELIPDEISGFECDDADKMAELWPAGTDSGVQALERFIGTKPRKSQTANKSVLEPGEEEAALKFTRLGQYQDQRIRLDMDSTSRLSPYLATGAISARMCARKIMEKLRSGFKADRESGPGMWLQEIGWRDFYTHILAAFPRVSMGRPFQEKYADVFWEEDVDGSVLEAWKQGKTGVPIVDAAMRQCQTQGYMHNRARMIAAMFLVKDLMLDWRLGERHFMRNFIDGDLCSNNGGWQWCASTGTDAQPYFRVFNPYLQSEKADPDGHYIRTFVPELKHLKGKVVHDPYSHMPEHEFKKLGYPKPMVDHQAAKERAIRRFRDVGEQ